MHGEDLMLGKQRHAATTAQTADQEQGADDAALNNSPEGSRSNLLSRDGWVALTFSLVLLGTFACVYSGDYSSSNIWRQPFQEQQFNTSKSIWHKNIVQSAALAERMLTAAGVNKEARAGRIFIPLLSTRPDWTCQMLAGHMQNVAPFNNPSDIFVFSVNNAAEAEFLKRRDNHSSACSNVSISTAWSTLHFMPVKEYWEVPEGSAANASLWSYPGMPQAYRVMGSWRLAFPYTLADMLGYQYLWQLDDDSEVVEPVNASLVSWMQQHKLKMAYWRVQPDPAGVTWGLPELTRTFIVAERYTPAGPLLTQHTLPHGIDGLYTTRVISKRGSYATSKGGWDRMILYGNNIMVDLEFWFAPLVQRYIEIVYNSGYAYRFRWNEQGPMGMIWQMFVPDEQSRQLPLLPGSYKHKNITIEGCQWPNCIDNQGRLPTPSITKL